MSDPQLPEFIDDARAVVVRVGGAEFGIDVRRVREVLRAPSITRLPFPPPAVLGIVSVRGTLVPVVDLGERLHGSPADRDGRLVIVRDPDEEGSVGLLVDAVLDLVALDVRREESPPEVEASLPPGWVLGILAPGGDRLVTLLDLKNVLELGKSADEERR